MPLLPHRLVLDTNVLVRALGFPASSSATVLDACLSRTLLALTCRPLLAEYRDVLRRPSVRQHLLDASPDATRKIIERLDYTSDRIDITSTHFRLDRDPSDEHLIRLAIAGAATHLVTYDPDLLSLPLGRDGPAKQLRRRLPQLSILTATEYLNLIKLQQTRRL